MEAWGLVGGGQESEHRGPEAIQELRYRLTESGD